MSHLAVVLCPHLDQARIDDGVHHRRQVRLFIWVVFSSQPFLDIEVAGSVERNRVLVEDVGHQDEIAIGSELIGDELCVVEAVADNVRDAVGQSIASG